MRKTLRILFPPIDRRADRRTMMTYFRQTLVMYYWCILAALMIWWVMVGLNLSNVYVLLSSR